MLAFYQPNQVVSCVVAAAMLSSKYTVSEAEAEKSVLLGADYLALRAFMGWPIGANELQICVVLPFLLITGKYL